MFTPLETLPSLNGVETAPCDCRCGYLPVTTYVKGKSYGLGTYYRFFDEVRAEFDSEDYDADWQVGATPAGGLSISAQIGPGYNDDGVLVADYYQNILYDTDSGTPPYDTDPGTYYNTIGPSACIYKLHVDLGAPWIDEGRSIVVSWRERTVISSYSIHSEDGAISGSEDYAVSYANFSETLTPTPGATFVETSEHTIPCPAMGAFSQTTVCGPSATRFLQGMRFARRLTSGATLYKLGFAQYTQDSDSPAVAVYRTETATEVAGGRQGFAGGRTITTNDAGTFAGMADTLSGAVERRLCSPLTQMDVDDVYGENLGVFGPTAPGALTLLSPNKLTWANGLILTLSTLDPTSRLTTAAAAAAAPNVVGGVDLAFADGGNTPGRVAYFCLPVSELSCLAQRGEYSVTRDPNAAVFATVASLIPGNPPLYAPSGSITALWDETTVNLDTGERTVAAQNHTFTWSDGSAPPAMPAIAEPVPGANVEVIVGNLRPQDGAFAALNIGIIAEIVEG